MCTHEQRCIDGIISASGLEGHTRPEQATVLGVARSQLLAVIAGRELPSVIDRIAEHTGSTPDELRLAMKTQRCAFRRARRDRNPYGARIDAFCAEANLTLEELRQKAGVDRTSFYHALGEGGRPGLPHLVAVAQALGLDSDEVVDLAARIGEPTGHALDTERLMLGLTRRQFAHQRNISVSKLFDLSVPRSPSEAYRVALGQTGDIAAAQQAAAAVPTRVHTEIGRMMRSWMDATGATPAMLADRVGVARQSIVAWSAGVALPSSGAQRTIATVIGAELAAVQAAVRSDRQSVKARRTGAGAHLRALRQLRRLNRTDFASAIGCSSLQLRLAESGHLPEDEIDRLIAAATAG